MTDDQVSAKKLQKEKVAKSKGLGWRSTDDPQWRRLEEDGEQFHVYKTLTLGGTNTLKLNC